MLETLWRDPDLALDLGSSHTRLLAPGVILVDTPTTVPGLGSAPVSRGVVVDRRGAVRLLEPLLRPNHRPGRRRPRVVASVPVGASAEAREALVDVLRRAGADRVETVPSLLAAAIGAGVDLSSPHASLVVDLGAELTEMGVVRDGELLTTRVVPAGTADVDLAELDPATPRGAWAGVLATLGAFWRSLPLGAQVETIESGVVLTGGGGLRPRLVGALSAALRLDVRAIPAPAQAVVRGLAALLR